MVTRQALSWALCLDGRASCQSSQKTVRYMTLALEWVRPQSILRRSCCSPHLHCRGSMTSCNLGPRWKAIGRSQPLWRTSAGASPTRASLPENCPQICIIPLQWHRRIWVQYRHLDLKTCACTDSRLSSPTQREPYLRDNGQLWCNRGYHQVQHTANPEHGLTCLDFKPYQPSR